jgi:hypothetical protein
MAATTLDIDGGQVARYRNLVRDRALTR